MLMSLSSVDVMEVFSPARFTQLAGKFGLRPGIAVDLDEFKENGETKWDLDRKQDVQEVHEYIDREDPYLATGSPPCETCSARIKETRPQLLRRRPMANRG